MSHANPSKPRAARTRASKVQLAVVVSLACLAGYGLFVAVKNRVAASRRTSCMTNLRVMGQALRLYVSDNDGAWPPREAWAENRISARPLQGCPSAEALPPSEYGFKPQPVIAGYAYNSNLTGAGHYADGFFISAPTRDSAIRSPNLLVSVCEQASDVVTTNRPDPFPGGVHPLDREQGFLRHGGGAHYLFCDGHVKWYKPEAVLPGDDSPYFNTKSEPTFSLK